jgi:hypothetical protein
MTITASSLHAYAVSRDNAVTFDQFPRGPNKSIPSPSIEPFARLNRTKQSSLYYDLVLRWEKMLFTQWLALNALFDNNNQTLILNYLGIGNNAGLEQWYYAPASWADPPTGEIDGAIVSSVEARFSWVEWFLPST